MEFPGPISGSREPTSGVVPRGGAEPSGLPIEPTARGGLLPVSFAQQRLWFVAQMFPQAPTYNEPIMVQMAEPVDVMVLAQCLTEITRRHEAWRTVFTTVDGVPMQQILPPRPFELPIVDLAGFPVEEREPEALRLAVADARRPFDLRQGPLVRALLIRLSTTDTRLVVTAHHIVVDGVSFFQVFLPELHALYVAFSNGQPSPLPPLSIQYADFAAWQRAWLTEEELAPKLSYWRTHMAGLTELALPADHPRPNQPTWEGARISVALPADLTAKLRDLGHRAGVTLFTTLLAAWKTLLFRYSGQNDIVVGSASAGRPRPELDSLIGFFNHNLVLRTQLHGSLTFLELLPRVGEVLKSARDHEDVPFDRLIAELSVDRSLNKNPIYQNVFILMPRLPPLDGAPRWNASRFDIGTAKVDVYLELHQRRQGLVGHIEYQTDLFSAATIERMVGHFATLLEGIVHNPEQRISELPLLTAAEEQQLAVWQGPAVAPVPDSEVLSLEQLFEAQVARSPSAIAVEHGHKRLTYAELNARANQLAHYLRSKGVGPDTPVGLSVERSIDAMVGILGVLKAGGAYVPLDPYLPADRLRFMMEDANLPLLLTNSRHARTVQPRHSPAILLDNDWPVISQQSTENPVPIAAPENLAYILYTSGSTGRPKGVLVDRRGLYHIAKAQEPLLGLGVGSRVLQFFTLNFDGSVWNLTSAWPVGATLILGDENQLLPGIHLVQMLREKRIHALMLTPSALAVMPYQELPELHTLMTIGEVLPEELVTRWARGRRFLNTYGPTETTIVSTLGECRVGGGKPSIGRPFDFVPVYILDDAMNPVSIGVAGELYIGGPGVARGYLNRPDLTQARFVNSPFPETAGTRIYKTGDRVRWLPDGTIDYLGRTDRQIKLRGYRIELGEIETVLARHPDVQTAAVEVLDAGEEKRLVAYVVPRAGAPEELESTLKKYLADRLPSYMVPAAVVVIEDMPVSSSGKLDRVRLSSRPPPKQSVTTSSSSLEQAVAAIWQEVLGIDGIDVNTPFFEVGGHSLALARVQAKLTARLGVDVDLMKLLQLPTIRQLAGHLATMLGIEKTPSSSEQPAPQMPSLDRSRQIAIVGMAIRAPGVRSPEELWDVVRSGRETICALNSETLIAAGADAGRVRRPDFVSAEGVLDDAERFDADFFSYSDADAALMDPQQRQFLECAYEALEHAGVDPSRFRGRIGVFGGISAPLYWLGPVTDALRAAGGEQERYRAYTLNSPDFLTTRVAFKLGLRGPAVTVQTACSTGLSAVHMARRSLLAGECDIALAGGVSITSLREADRGYIRAEGGLGAADGHCRPFDADASGMVPASGVAIVALKRLEDALAGGDTIHAVICGSAMNNDGAGKASFTAPSDVGLAGAIEHAYETAGIDPGSVQFLEAHGTGTRLGDPTEVGALVRAFRRWTEQRGFCALGSLKANLGHLDSAAGAAGIIRAALALSHEVIPPLASFHAPNPLLNLPSTPFFVNNAPIPWPRTKSPRRAGVNAMGIGGTNVHVILEEAPAIENLAARGPFFLLCLSARTETALVEVKRRLAAHLATHPFLDIGDVAHTLAVGRAQQKVRTAIVCQDISQARGTLAPEADPAPSVATPKGRGARTTVFLFPGHGVQYLKMGLHVYEAEPVYRTEIDRCAELLHKDTGVDILALLFAKTAGVERQLDQMHWAQPFLFATEYALAKQLLTWGVHPAVLLGHSVGEYVAACIGGVFSLRDALALIAARGRLMDATPAGTMLTVFAEQDAIEPYLDAGVSIATYAPGCVVLSGSVEAIQTVCARFAKDGIETSSVRVSRASHSPLMHSIRDAFQKRVAEISLKPPAIPIISNVTGAYLTAEQATSPDYWTEHLCSPVRLAEGLGALFDLESPLCLELGPGSTLGSFFKGHRRYEDGTADVVGMLPGFRVRDESAYATVLHGLGRAWQLGLEVNWQAFYGHERRHRIPLPTYPFEGRKHMLQTTPRDASVAPVPDPAPLDVRAAAIAADLGVRSIQDYPNLRRRLDELCASLVLDFFARKLGHRLRIARSLETLQQSTGILSKFMPMLELLVQVLVGAGLAEKTTSGEFLLQAELAGRSTELSARLRHDYPAFTGLTRFIEHCVTHYDEALTGAAEPVGVLYPDGTDGFYRSCMRDTAPYAYNEVYLGLAREVVLGLIQRWEGQTIRILEVGAGHGTLTWPLAERLHGRDIDYHFTDIGRSFLVRAEAEAARRDFRWMKAIRFDLNRPPQEQGFHDHYDIILGLNAVHVALDLPAALRNLHDLLTPGGSLILIEMTHMETWDRLTWGLAPGYWDIARVRGGLSMDLTRWEHLLRSAGFTSVTIVPRDEKMRLVEDHGLLIAERAIGAQPPEHLAEVTPHASPAASLMHAIARAHQRDTMPTNVTDDVEHLVSSVWKRLLGISQVARDRNFFELGGDSLLAVQLLAELRVKTGREIKMRQFALHPTVGGIARLLDGNAQASPLLPSAAMHDGRTGPIEAFHTSEQPECTNAVSLESSSHEPDEAAVRAFIRRYIDGTLERDSTPLFEELWVHHGHCTLIAIDGSIIAGAPAIEKHLAASFATRRDTRLRLYDERVHILSPGQLACVTAHLDSDLTLASNGRHLSYRGVRVSWILQRQHGAWRAVHAHYSLPVGESIHKED